MTEREKQFMRMAVTLSRKGMDEGQGGPFGAVVVRGDEVIGQGYNRVLADRDPTAHAEIVAIREACLHTTDFMLEGCEIYTSCEPCPMCLGAIYWARPDRVYYANTRRDAAAIGFDDDFIYQQLNVPTARRKIPMIAVDYPEALRIFDEWQDKPDKHAY